MSTVTSEKKLYHFGNIEELLQGMYSYVIDRFSTALKQAK
ncbi:UNVERIFIED_CONTAM: hypothetical protein C7383_101296 [Murimonas intestini]|uniref:Uncharacterized protein n=1 Tax=Murimonas intestini TaxID=1337051 RepID=A0AB73T9U1_9FIRM